MDAYCSATTNNYGNTFLGGDDVQNIKERTGEKRRELEKQKLEEQKYTARKTSDDEIDFSSYHACTDCCAPKGVECEHRGG